MEHIAITCKGMSPPGRQSSPSPGAIPPDVRSALHVTRVARPTITARIVTVAEHGVFKLHHTRSLLVKIIGQVAEAAEPHAHGWSDPAWGRTRVAGG